MKKMVMIFVMMLSVLIVSCSEDIGPTVALTAGDLTLKNEFYTTFSQIETAIRNGRNITMGGEVIIEPNTGTTQGTIIAGTIHALRVPDVTTPSDAITYDQSALLTELFNPDAVPRSAKYTIDDFALSVGGTENRVLTLTASVNAKFGYFLPADESLDEFIITISISTGTTGSQDRWTP